MSFWSTTASRYLGPYHLDRSQKNVSEIPENRAEPYLSSKLSINNHHALQPPDHEEVVWLWPSIGPDDRVDMLIWAGWCPEETVKVDRSQTCSPCPSLTYSASDCSDLDRLEESLNTKHMHGEDPASTEISDRPPFATKSYRSSSDNQKTGYSIRASSRDRDDDDSGGRDGCPAPEGSREAERMVVGDEEHKVACPFRKHNPLRFNIREYHWCAAKPLNSFAELRYVSISLHYARLMSNEVSQCASKEISFVDSPQCYG